MFRVQLRMQTHPGKEQDFERAWLSGAGVITGQPANRGQWLYASAQEPGVYHIISDWVDEPSFREYERSPQHREHRVRLHPYRAAGSMTTMTTVYALEKQ
ncbi:MAG: antibiotic biosynthesis monooxygenase [Micromonosporaceae bacterium]|nr:antibiotic biosynthesis monooxygenase [Micromonosporaceae bacterium]